MHYGTRLKYTFTYIMLLYSNSNIMKLYYIYFSFDAPKIEQLARQLELYDRFKELVYGYADTLFIFKKKNSKTQR